MLYLDYDDAPWTPNKDGGNLNYEGYYFLQRLNDVIKLVHPDVMMIAEESSSQLRLLTLRIQMVLASTTSGIWAG